MDRLSRPPEELTSQIVQQVAHESLPALASVSHQFHRLVIPRLYRCVYYDEMDEINERDTYRVTSAIHIGTRDTTMTRPNSGDWPLCQSSKIFKLNLFLRTINTCPEIRSQITTVGFYMSGLINGNFFVSDIMDLLIVSDIIDLLLSSLQILDVSPFSYNLKPTVDMALKSLRTCYGFWTHQWCQDPAGIYLFSLFQIPTLRNLFIENLPPPWDTLRTHRPQYPADRSRSRTSNVTSLSLTVGMPFTDDLMEILSWPKALEVFELGRPPASLDGPVLDALPSPRKLAEVLSLQQHSLRELYVADHLCKETKTISDDATLGDLHNFVALNRLCVPKHYLVISEEHTRPFTKDDLTKPHIWEILPPSIGELRLEIRSDSRWYDTEPPFADKARELATWLSGLVEHKSTHCPNLQEIVVWHPGLSGDRQTRLLKELRKIPSLLQELEMNEVRLLFSRNHWLSLVGRMEISEFCYELVSIRR